MNNTMYPCLWFDGNAKEAAEFYCSVFPNSKIPDEIPLVVNFKLGGKHIMGLNGGPMFKFNPSISLFVYCKSIEETNLVWDKLFDGGKELIPIDKYPWSERYGWLEDKFGFTWQISVADYEDAKLKITPAMLFTGDQFGRAEEAIYFYSSIFENSSTEVLIHYEGNDPNKGKVMYSDFVNMNSDYASYQILLRQANDFEQSFHAAEVRFADGAISTVDYIIAKNNYERVLINLVSTKYNYVLRTKLLDFYQDKALW
jgi:predicted 3-demethylubiquinone-9 3-methyltransferase (glyoxalase superfamily)